jgi:hypothetical protein
MIISCTLRCTTLPLSFHKSDIGLGTLEQQRGRDIQVAIRGIESTDSDFTRDSQTHEGADGLLRMSRGHRLRCARCRYACRCRSGGLSANRVPGTGEVSTGTTASRLRRRRRCCGIFGRLFERLRLVRQFVLREEGDLSIPNAKTMFLKVDAGLMGFEHVKAEK